MAELANILSWVLQNMKLKRKIKTKILRCNDGETYVFRNGIAIVKGAYFQGKEMYITIHEFNEINGGKV